MNVLNDIKEEINSLKTLIFIDIVDFSRISDDFKEIALKERIVINERGIER